MGDVINLFGNKKKEEKQLKKKIEKNLEKLEKAAGKEAEENFDFEAIMKKNSENKERIAKEKAKANKGVIRSHRLKK